MREKNSEKIEVHVATISFFDGKVLIAKRSPTRKLFPEMWECGGGQVKSGESFKQAAKRQFKEEFSVEMKPLQVIGTYEIRSAEQDVFIPGLTFACKIEANNEDDIRISEEHTECKLVDIKELDQYELIDGLRSAIERAKWVYDQLK